MKSNENIKYNVKLSDNWRWVCVIFSLFFSRWKHLSITWKPPRQSTGTRPRRSLNCITMETTRCQGIMLWQPRKWHLFYTSICNYSLSKGKKNQPLKCGSQAVLFLMIDKWRWMLKNRWNFGHKEWEVYWYRPIMIWVKKNHYICEMLGCAMFWVIIVNDPL